MTKSTADLLFRRWRRRLPGQGFLLFIFALGALFAVWSAAAVFDVLGQRKLIYCEGEEELYDFWMPRMCLEQGYVGHPERYAGLRDVRKGEPIELDERDVIWSDWYTDGSETMFVTGWRDKVYPAFALLPLKPFPATRFGGYLWSATAGLLLLLSICLISRSWWPMVFALSMPFIFNLERGNPVWLSAAFAGIFVAWWDDEREWKRMVAAACLAAAGAMKIAPFALGALYFTKWRWRPIILCGLLSLAFVFVPWFLIPDGPSALPVMIRNAAEHSQYVLRTSDFGLIQLWRTLKMMAGESVQAAWPGMKTVAVISQLIGLATLALGVRRRDYVLVVGGMLWAAGNMYYYGMLYMLPVFALELSRRKSVPFVEFLLWLVILSPVQLIIMTHSANQVLGNLALLSLHICRGCFARWGEIWYTTTHETHQRPT